MRRACFALAGPPEPDAAEPVLLAEPYHEGRLDWYSFDLVGGRKLPPEDDPAPAAPLEEVESLLPGPGPPLRPVAAALLGDGGVADRFRQDRDLGDRAALIYSNDWFMLPHPMPVNTLCEIRSIVVDDTFGRHRSSQQGRRFLLERTQFAACHFCTVHRSCGKPQGTLKRSAGAGESVTG